MTSASYNTSPGNVISCDYIYVPRWYHEERDPTAETVVDIVEALKNINDEAADDFIRLYLGIIVHNKKESP